MVFPSSPPPDSTFRSTSPDPEITVEHASADPSVRQHPLGEQPTVGLNVTFSPKFHAESQDQSTIPSHVGISENFSDLWPSAHKVSGSVTTTEPLAHGKPYLPSYHDSTDLTNRSESLSDIIPPYTTRKELSSQIRRPRPSSPTTPGIQPARSKPIKSRANAESQGSRSLSTSRTELDRQSAPVRPTYASPPSIAGILQAALPLFQGTFAPPHSQSRLPNPLASTLARDALLTYANQIYRSPFQPAPGAVVPPAPCELTSPQHPYRTHLLPLLRNLKLLHPRYIPILLLLGCVYQAVGDYAASMHENEEILNINENFAEAMSNLGSTLKAMGRIEEGEKWWWKAISLKPTYWDAIYNLMGTLVPETLQPGDSSNNRQIKALELCDSIKSNLIGPTGSLLLDIPADEIHHVQNILYIGATIRGTLSEVSIDTNLLDYALIIEILLRFNDKGKELIYSFKDLILATTVAALILTSALPPLVQTAIYNRRLGEGTSPEAGRASDIPNLLGFVHEQADDLLQLLLSDSRVLPTVFLSPAQAAQLSGLVLSAFNGTFPWLWQRTRQGENAKELPASVIADVGKITSSALLGVAKILQEDALSNIQIPGFNDHVRSSPSFVLILYYLAYCFHPSASTCNNMGIMLSTIPWTNVPAGLMGQQDGIIVHQLARVYYEEGLRIVSNDTFPLSKSSHPHLLTNYGSLLKELGDVESAIMVYSEAVKLKPDFDVALANLANALKDSGRIAESVLYYRQAVQVNEGLPEALCGMIHAVWSICDWRGLGQINSSLSIDFQGNAHSPPDPGSGDGWMPRLMEITRKQISGAYKLNRGIIRATGTIEDWLGWIESSINVDFSPEQKSNWKTILQLYFSDLDPEEKETINEGGFMIRIVEWLTKVLQWRWYTEVYGHEQQISKSVHPLYHNVSAEHRARYRRPRVPSSMILPASPSVLPFHTFIYPFNARELRLVARRNAFRTSYATLIRPWLPEHVYPPPPPPHPRINIGYISSDFIDHPTAHLLQSVFGMHDRQRFCVYTYATTPSDGSPYRIKIQTESEHFRDVSTWSTQQIVEQVIQDEIHILVNLNGYTKGARNDIFAARPCPVQISFLGFAGTLAAGWSDYMICDAVSCPPATRFCEICGTQTAGGVMGRETSEIDFSVGPDPESTIGWKYAEKLIYMPHTYLVTDHRQTYGSGAEEANPRIVQQAWTARISRKRRLRKLLFPDLFEDTVVFANFNQMYKIDPSIFATWLRILKRVPHSILWLLRFPKAAEEHLLRTAELWEGENIRSRIRFTEVAPKSEHIERACVADIFLDTVECNAHTVATDVLWSGVPIVTWPKYDFKMCSRVGSSIAYATGYGGQMVVDSLKAYEDRAVKLALSITPVRTPGSTNNRDDRGELAVLQRNLFMNRGTMPLFDTQRWTKYLEKGYEEAWERWTKGASFLHFKVGDSERQYENCSGFIWIKDEET